MTTRRQFLLGGAGATAAFLVTACAADAEDVAAETSAPAGDDLLRRDAISSERALIASVDAALAVASAGTRELLTAIRGEHVQHLAAFGASAEDLASPAAPAPDPLGRLRDLEREASRGCRTACVAAQDAELARLFAFVAASESGHAVALRQAAR